MHIYKFIMHTYAHFLQTYLCIIIMHIYIFFMRTYARIMYAYTYLCIVMACMMHDAYSCIDYTSFIMSFIIYGEALCMHDSDYMQSLCISILFIYSSASTMHTYKFIMHTYPHINYV